MLPPIFFLLLSSLGRVLIEFRPSGDTRIVVIRRHAALVLARSIADGRSRNGAEQRDSDGRGEDRGQAHDIPPVSIDEANTVTPVESPYKDNRRRFSV